jgi:IclR family pca regulon transcriptional regulator
MYVYRQPRVGGRPVSTRPSDPDHLQSLERGLRLLTVFSPEHPALTVSEAARLAAVTRPTARRILLTLEALGYVRRDGESFVLSPRVLDIGYRYLSSLKLNDIAEPCMEQLVERVHESSSAAVLDGEEIVYVARVPTKRIMTISLGLGSRLPAYCTSLGRVLLAGLPPGELDAYFERTTRVAHTDRTVTDERRLREILTEVREQGWALVDQELELGIRSAATALRDRKCTVAALNVSAHAGRVSLQTMRREFLPALLETATKISEQLAHR